MKATIVLTTPQQTNQVLKSLITLIQGSSQLQQQITNHGIWFENLTTATVAAFKQLLHKQQYSAYASTDTSVHLQVAHNDVNALLKILLQILQSSSELSKPLWASGVSLFPLTADQANDLKKQLEADSAVVTITDSPAPPQPYTLSGTVVDATSGNHLFDAQLVILFQRGGQDLGSETVTTLSTGEFLVPLEASLWTDRPSGQTLSVSFQVSQNGQPLATDTRIPDLQPQDQSITVRVTVPNVEPEGTFIVQGTVSSTDGSALPDALVRAFDRDMRHEEFLGAQATKAQGFYQISYTPGQFRRAEKGSADLVVRVYRQTDATASVNLVEVAASEILFNAPPVATIDVTVPAAAYRGPSEWERHHATILPLRETVEVAALTDEDLEFLSRETEITIEHLRHLRQDAQWAEAHDVADAVFYGLLRQGLPTELRSLLAEPPSRLRAALAENLIPQALADDLDGILERLLELAVQMDFLPDEDSEIGARLVWH